MEIYFVRNNKEIGLSGKGGGQDWEWEQRENTEEGYANNSSVGRSLQILKRGVRAMTFLLNVIMTNKNRLTAEKY